MKDTIVIGKITGAHGIKGEIKIFPLTDDADRFYDTKYFICEDKRYEVTGVRMHQGCALVTSTQIADRNAAEIMKGKMVEVLREDAVDLDENEYFIEDLKGLTAYDTASDDVYTLRDVFTAGPVNVLEFISEKGNILLPFLSENVSEVNIGKGYIKADMGKGVKS